MTCCHILRVYVKPRMELYHVILLFHAEMFIVKLKSHLSVLKDYIDAISNTCLNADDQCIYPVYAIESRQGEYDRLV